MKYKLKKLLISAICASMLMSSMTAVASSDREYGVEETALYYSSWNEAYEALKSYCGVADPSHYTEAQGDLIIAFLDKWPDIIYGATNEKEAKSLLKQAKAEFDALPLDDEEAMKEHEKFMVEREKVFYEKLAILESNIANAEYTKASRDKYETAAREALGIILNSYGYDVLNSGKAAFDACVSMLVKVGPELKAAQEAAKNELASILANEYDNITTIGDFYSRIDDCNNENEIASVVEDCKEYMLACVNADIATYRNNKLTKAADYCRSFESELETEKFNELKTFYRNNMGTLSQAANKADVDRAYNDLLTALDSKVAELLGGGGTAPEEPEEPKDVAVTGISLDKTEATIEVDETLTLTATVTPDDATDKTVTWTTSDSAVATVDANGKVTALAVGTAAITAKAGEKSAACIITVEADTPDPDIGGGENNPFKDVEEGRFFYEPVLWALKNEVTTGTSPTTFSPNEKCSRAQVVTFLWRAIHRPKASNKSAFTDLKPGAFYEEAVDWAVEDGITTGTSPTTFSPNEACTRGQFVTFLWRTAGCPEASNKSAFTDLKPGAFYEKAVNWAVEEGITTGTSPTTFSPDEKCSRAQVVTFLYRYIY